MFFKQITGLVAASRTVRVTGVLLIVSLCALGCEAQQATMPASDSFDAAQAEDAIRAVLNEQETAWNNGDIDAFMDGYARTDSLRFASGGTVQTGWQMTIDRYHQAYPDRAAMGTLSFTLHDVRVLSPRYALVFGAWQLDRAEDQPSGLFTLLFEHRPEGWRIIADHTSSAS